MDKLELKSNLHVFIDQIENIELLRDYYWEMKRLIKTRIWDTLTESQKKEILLSYEESENNNNLIDHEEVMKKFK
ncbi:hypothetical protein ES705_34498 [subsurface metagenome]